MIAYELDQKYIFPKLIASSFDSTFVEECQKDIVEYGRNQVYHGQNENDKILPPNAFDGGWCLGVNAMPASCDTCGDGRAEMPHLARVQEQIIRTCHESYGIYLNIGISVYCQWMNWTEPHGYAIGHVHGSTSQLTGAFFIDVPEDSGNLYFEDVDMEIMPTCGFQAEDVVDNEKMNVSTFYEHKPRNGECVIFHPMIRHRVGTNNSKLPRVSLAFDLRIGM
ncbi:hypothetical protein Np450711_203 [Cyanophage S-RIM14]|uniref:Uncharacterized protein n=1 Tax=Cyanophage S-RIM14 TaxID=1278423 RepID=A0A1D7SJ72_9CAUD|nr:hypothetical protein LIS110610_203 [Cyanophage S-RIM14]AOO13748.1 hypothetical protein Np111211_203 [Cyanophage S-RIM14]AOO13964.1 hypothetical protein Np450711_203 [Cyanophage S-RIM14]AOO14616.1 hypothetical protein Sn180910_203 [Cyanophage S-RIM14]AOO15049.1 hypothetical protein W1230910_204 [Cyanophage S-RIM14]